MDEILFISLLKIFADLFDFVVNEGDKKTQYSFFCENGYGRKGDSRNGFIDTCQ